MADIASSDVTYTVEDESVEMGSNYQSKVVKLAFGDGSLTYPAGGVPLDKNKLGLPNVIKSLSFVDADDSNGFVYKYDAENEKIRIYQGDNDAGADGPLVELGGGSATPAAATVRVHVRGW